MALTPDRRLLSDSTTASGVVPMGLAIPMPVRFRGITVREGALIQGPAGWGEFSPFAEYGPKESARWLASALESATLGWPEPTRTELRPLPRQSA